MSDELNPQPLNPVVRFGMRTILIAMAVLAVATAIAAPYWRAQKPEVQAALLVFWSSLLVFAGLGGWLNWRRSWQLAPQAGAIVNIAWATGRRRWLPAGSLLTMSLAVILTLFAVGSQTWVIARRNNGLSPSRTIPLAGLNGMSYGFMLGGAVFLLMRRPIYLCDGGVSGAIGFAPWKFIRHAEWQANRPNVMKLRRLDGDIFLDVPNNIRTEVEVFVRSKRLFIDDLPHCPRLEEPGAK